MSKISNIITSQNFELYRDRIVQILQLELNNQYALTSNPLYDITIYTERFVPFDNAELPAGSVRFVSSTFLEKNHRASKYSYTFWIQLNASSKRTDADRGDKLSSNSVEKLAGVVRYILEHEAYKTLDFPALTANLFNTKINSINIVHPSEKNSTFITAAVLEFIIEANEIEGFTLPVDGTIYTSQMKLEESEKGYFFQINV